VSNQEIWFKLYSNLFHMHESHLSFQHYQYSTYGVPYRFTPTPLPSISAVEDVILLWALYSVLRRPFLQRHTFEFKLILDVVLVR
jgi:hypothetical protein